MSRLKGKTELNIDLHDLKGSQLQEVRNQLNNIKFEIGITVLALQPEVGKTYSFIKYCEDNPDKTIAYFAPNHDLLDEVEKRIKEKMPSSNVIHWRGIGKICKLYQDEPFLTTLIDHGLTIHSFCEDCNYSNDCQYEDHRKQFEYQKPAIILAPLEYIKGHAEEFDAVFVDELITKCYAYSLPDEKEITQAVGILRSFGYSPVLDEITAINNPDKFNEIDFKELRRVLRVGMSKILPNLKDFNLLAKVLFDINQSMEFLKYRNIYKNSGGYEKSLKTYYEPYIYKLFELAQKIPVILMDATFQEELFSDLLQGYDGEFGIKNNFSVNIYYSCVENKETIIYRVNPNSWYPKSSITPRIIKGVKNLYNIHIKSGKKVGIITHKDIEPQFEGFETLHYGNLRGQNKFENFDVLILLGTYQPHPIGTINDHNELYLTDLSKSTKVIAFDTDEDADNYAKTKDPKYGHIKTVCDYAVVNLKDNFDKKGSLSELLFSWDIPIKQHVWLFVMNVLDINEVKNPDVDWFFTANVEKTPDNKTIKMYDNSHSILLTLNDSQDKITLTMDDEKTQEFPVRMNTGSLSIFMPYRFKYPYLDGRRRYIRTKRQRYLDDKGESISEEIKVDLIEIIKRENELYQAIYRIRPLSKPKVIYVWGIVPEDIKGQLRYEEIEKIDSHIIGLKQDLIRNYNPEKHFAEGKEINRILDEIVNEIGCAKSTADKIISKYLDISPVWCKGKKNIPASKKPIYILVKKAL